MKKNEIEVGVTYHNGKTGNRSYSSRQVLEVGGRMSHPLYGVTYPDGVRFKQIKGRNSGEGGVMGFDAFAQWAKGRVGEETDNA